jgi:hypothetical protein
MISYLLPLFQPTHPGAMIQFGQNAGPRHLSIFGHVRNLKDAHISAADREKKDQRLLGIFGLVWNLFVAISPAPTIDACNRAMDDSGIPRMETADDNRRMSNFFMLNVSQQMLESGYTLDFEDGAVTFNTAIRAPCEGYMLQDYAACVLLIRIHKLFYI